MVVYTATEIGLARKPILTLDSLARKIDSGSCNRRRSWMLRKPLFSRENSIRLIRCPARRLGVQHRHPHHDCSQ